MSRLTKADAAAIIIAMREVERHGMVISAEKMRDIIEIDPDVVKCVNGYPATASGFDTYDSGYLHWAIARSVGYEDWPTNYGRG